jgi:hypothetical protein
LIAPVAASATRLKDVRVGVHGDKTRVVIETDGAVYHRLAEGEREIRVRVDAIARASTVTPGGKLLGAVTVVPRGSTAEIRLQLNEPAELRSFTLRKPDRLVLDLYERGASPGGKPTAAAAAKPKPAAAAAAKPVPAPAQEPEPVAPAPEPEPEPVELSIPTPDELEREAAAALSGSGPAAGAPDAGPSDVAGADPDDPVTWEELQTADAGGDPTQEPAPAAAPEAGAAATTPATTEPSGIPRSTILIGALVLLAIGALVFIRGRRPAAELGAAGDSEVPFTLDEMLPREGQAEEEAPAAEASVAPPEEADDLPSLKGAELQAPLPGSSAGAAESMFDADEPMPPPSTALKDRTVQKPAAATAPPSVDMEAPTFAAVSGAAGELENRIAQLESRLEEVVDSKERLERQVVAQTEELRVQRAAIARTQRILRGMTRPEDEATEPVPKN